MSKNIELPNATPFEDLSFWKCIRCDRAYVSMKDEWNQDELRCTFCYGNLMALPIHLPRLK